MKKVLFSILAVLMILPVIASCSSAPQGEPVEVANVKIISYLNAYEENETGALTSKVDKELAQTLFEGAVNAYVTQGETMTLSDLMKGYAYELDSSAYYDEGTKMYTRLQNTDADEESGWFWNYYVNGKESGLGTEIKAEDKIEIVLERNARG